MAKGAATLAARRAVDGRAEAGVKAKDMAKPVEALASAVTSERIERQTSLP